MRHLFLISLLLFLVTPLRAQENTATPYEIALERIEEARASGATRLMIAEIGLTVLPPEIQQLTNLQTLRLENNALTTLPPWISTLTNLESLYVYNNHLVSLPPEIGAITNLRTLSASHNALQTLPEAITQLSNLKLLSIGSNQLQELPHDIGQLSNLCELDIRNNQIQRLPASLGQLTQMSDRVQCEIPNFLGLVLDGNPLVDPPPEVVEQGTLAILDYLQEKYESQQNGKWLRLFLSSLSGWIVIYLLGVYAIQKDQFRRKSKKKREIP